MNGGLRHCSETAAAAAGSIAWPLSLCASGEDYVNQQSFGTLSSAGFTETHLRPGPSGSMSLRQRPRRQREGWPRRQVAEVRAWLGEGSWELGEGL